MIYIGISKSLRNVSYGRGYPCDLDRLRLDLVPDADGGDLLSALLELPRTKGKLRQAATKAAESAMSDIRHDLDNERAKLSQAAGEARRETWRWFGGSGGCGWPLCSPQGRLLGRWRWHGYRGAAMPVSSGSFHAFIAIRRMVRI